MRIRQIAFLVQCAGFIFLPLSGSIGAPTGDVAPVAEVPAKAESPALAGTIPTATFGKRPFMQQPVISPDGRFIVTKLARGGRDILALVRVDGVGDSKPVFIMSNEEFRDAGDRVAFAWQWIGNDNIAISVASRERLFGQRADVTRLVGYNVKSKKITPLAWRGATASAADIKWIDGKNGTFLLSRTSNAYGTERLFLPEIVSVDVVTGEFSIVMQPNPVVEDWLVDSKGVVRGGLSYDNDTGKVRLLYRSGADDAMRTISNEADKTFTGASVVPEIFLDEPDMAIATSNKDGFRKVYKLNLKTLTLGPAIFERDGYDIGSVIPNTSGDALAGVSYQNTRDTTFWFDAKLAASQKLFDDEFGHDVARIISADDLGQKMIVLVGRPDQAGNYYVFDSVAANLTALAWYQPTLKDARLNPTSTITYTARDGTTIPAVVTMPRHRTQKTNLPVVVLVHGGPFGVRVVEEFGYFPWHQALAEMGYVVIEPNYRGSGGYGKDFVLKGRAPDGYGMKMQDDLVDALTALSAKGVIDPKRACIMGWSYGGYASARGAQRDPSVWKCAVAGAGLYDFPMMKASDTRSFGSFGASYQATASDLIAISPARNTAGQWSPIMIVAGLRDARIPIEQSRTLVSRLKASGKKQGIDFDYIEQPQGTHNLPYEDVHIQWLEAAQSWLMRFNPAYIASDTDKSPEIQKFAGSPALQQSSEK
jgi:dipeptidyl aminopeptidase/acylaminoacyl peptidase